MVLFLGARVHDTSDPDKFLDHKQPNTYDYIVVGASPSGCAIASRLAEAKDITVLLIDQAEQPPTWPSSTTPEPDDRQNPSDITSTGQVGLLDRKVTRSTNIFMGGGFHPTDSICMRPTNPTVEAWHLPQWNSDHLTKYMDSVEHYHPNDPISDTDSVHGNSGMLQTSYNPLSPLSHYLIDSIMSCGVPYKPDALSDGSHKPSCGNILHFSWNEKPSGAWSYIQAREDGWRAKGVAHIHGYGGLGICSETIVDRVILEDNPFVAEGEEGPRWRARGVVVRTFDRWEEKIWARREVILSAGTFGSVGVLIRSGIGSQSELDRLNISAKVCLEDVGKHLQLSPTVELTYELDVDALVALSDQKGSSYEETKVAAYLPLTSVLESQHQVWLVMFTTSPPTRSAPALLNMRVTLLHPSSRGTIRLQKSDCATRPLFDPALLTHPDDVRIQAEGCKQAHRIITKGKGTCNIVKGPWPKTAWHDKLSTDEQWEHLVRCLAEPGDAGVGTCRMASTDDDAREGNHIGVADEQLRVRGVSGLRVADMSVLPSLPGALGPMTAFAIGEKCADLIKTELQKEHDERDKREGKRRAV